MPLSQDAWMSSKNLKLPSEARDSGGYQAPAFSRGAPRAA